MANFEKACSNTTAGLMRKTPFLYAMILHTRIHHAPTVGTNPEVAGATDGVSILLTDAWLKSDARAKTRTLVHELFHIVFMHSYVMRSMSQKLGSDFRPKVANIAADLALMEPQEQCGQTPLIEFFPNANSYKGKDLQTIYVELVQSDDPETMEALASQEEGDVLPFGSFGDGTGGDVRLTPEDVEAVAKKVSDAIEGAASAASTGSIGNGADAEIVKDLLMKIRDSRIPTVPWDELLRTHSKALSPKTRLDAKRKHRRCVGRRVFVPARVKTPAYEITAAVDTSGSISEDMLQQHVAVCLSALQRVVSNVRLITFDTSVHEDEILNKATLRNHKITLHGGGGTEVDAVFKYLREDTTRELPNLLVVLTDGYLDPPAKPPYDVVWVINDNAHFSAPYGRVIHITGNENGQ